MSTETIDRTYDVVSSHAESIKNDAAHVINVMDDHDAWCQGDVMIVKLPRVPEGSILIPLPNQLAPGMTQGSRHMLDWAPGATAYVLADPTPLDGPIIDAPDGARVGHPEHGDVTLPPGVYGVTYQRAFADELKAVRD